MKKQIRRGVFETNSSSVHSLTMCTESEYDRWESGELLYWECRDGFYTKEDILKKLKLDKDYIFEDWDDENRVREIFQREHIYTSEQYFDDKECYFETFCQTCALPTGESVVAFGYYGHD